MEEQRAVQKEQADLQKKIAEATEKAKAAQQSSTKAAISQEKALQRQLQAQQKVGDARLSLDQRLIELQETRIKNEITVLERQLEQADNRYEAEEKINAIYGKRRELIELEYDKSILTLDQQARKLDISESIARSKKVEAELEIELARLGGKNVEVAEAKLRAAEDTLSALKATNDIIRTELEVTKQIAKEVKNQELSQNEIARKTELKALKEGEFANSAREGANALNNQAEAAANVAASISQAATSMAQLNSASQAGIGTGTTYTTGGGYSFQGF